MKPWFCLLFFAFLGISEEKEPECELKCTEETVNTGPLEWSCSDSVDSITVENFTPWVDTESLTLFEEAVSPEERVLERNAGTLLTLS